MEIEVSDDPNEICERMRTINVDMARSSRMLAEAKAHRREAERDSFAALPDFGNMPANIVTHRITANHFLALIIEASLTQKHANKLIL